MKCRCGVRLPKDDERYGECVACEAIRMQQPGDRWRDTVAAAWLRRINFESWERRHGFRPIGAIEQ